MRVPPGSKNMASVHQGSPGTGETRWLLLDKDGVGQPDPKSLARDRRSGRPGETNTERTGRYRRAILTKGGASRRSCGSRTPRSTEEAGEHHRVDPVEGGGVGLTNCWEETWPMYKNRILC